MLARNAMSIGAAIERPVVKDRELAIGGRVDVEFDYVGARSEGSPHGGNRVFQVGMRWRQYTGGGTRIVLDSICVKTLRNTAVGEQYWSAGRPLREQVSIIQMDEGCKQQHRESG